MIDIKDIQGNILLSVLITQSCQKVEELMVNDYIQLSWNSDSRETLPVGSYIEYDGERYSLTEPYSPSQKDEAEFIYTPQFKSMVMAWSKKPFFFYSGESKEPDWTLTSNPADFMRCVCDAISNETGETWSYSIDASLPASASLSFASVDILSGLNQIAEAFETEWYADKSTNTIYLGLLFHGDEVTLEVGKNINVPSVQGSKEGYYTRFYAFGSTRNIAQDYEGSNANNLVNKRLTLDPTKYPDGYKDIREGLSDGEIFSKVLIFDEVYPSADLSISGVRNRLMYRLGSDGKKIQLGTDESGNPIYDQYAIWYFRIEGFDFDLSNIIEGYKLSVSFQSGSLQGREFELKYYEKDTTITTSDGVAFEAKAGDYEILFVEEGSYIIPSMTGLVPTDGDGIVLFNIKMPSEYTQSAYDRLEEELDKEISRINSDLNNYTFKSNPVVFNDNNPNLSIGRNVKYVNGSYSFNTRVIKLTTHLDFPIEQEITIGNEKVKGNTQQLKEEVASANKDLNLLAVFNDMTQSLQQSYNRTQQMMLDGFAAIKNIWQLKTDSNGNTYAFSAFDVVTQKGITMYADGEDLDLPSIYSGLPIDQSTLKWIETTNSDGTVTRLLGINPDIDLGGGAATWDELEGKPSWIGSTKPSYNYSEISQTPDLTVYALTSDLAKYVTLADDETISGLKDFTKGIQIDGLGITKSQDDVIYLNANLVVRGGITMYAEGTVDVPSILESLPIASTTTKGIASFDSSYFSVDSDGKVTLLAENVGLNETELFDYLSRNNYAKKSDIPSLSGYATETYVEERLDDLINGAPAAYDTLKEIADVLAGNVDSIGDIITTLGTKADKATKISAGTGLSGGGTLEADRTLSLATSGVTAGTYKSVTVDTYGRVTAGSNPTTLAGYGITDAKISNGVITLGSATITPLTTHQTIYNLTLEVGAFTAATFDPNGAAKTVKIPTTTSHISEGSNLYFTDARAVSALTETLKAYVTLAGAQTITGEKNFTGGLKVNGSPIVYDATNKYWKLEGDLLVTGGVTMYGNDSEFTPSTIMDAITTDGTNLKVVDGVLTFVGSIDDGIASSVDWANVENKPSFATVATSGKYSDLSGTPTLLSSFTNDAGFIDSSALNSYLPLSGGTLTTKSNSATLILNTTSNDIPTYMSFYINSEHKGNIGYDFTHGLHLYNHVSGTLIDLQDTGNFEYTYLDKWEVLYMGHPTFNWNGQQQHPLLWAGNSNTLVRSFIAMPHIPFLKQDNRGYLGTSFGALIRFEGGISTNTYWDIGCPNHSEDNFFISYNNSKIASWGNNGLMGIYVPNEWLSPSFMVFGRIDTTVYSNAAVIGVTDGNLHLDSYQNKTVYINFYSNQNVQGLVVGGGILSTGGITMYSDIRKKTKLQDVELTLQQIANAPLIEHYYNSDAMRTTHVGSIAQYWAGLNDWFCKLDNEGYYTMEIQNAALASAISIARELTRYESKTDKKIRMLKKRISELEDKIELLEKKGE